MATKCLAGDSSIDKTSEVQPQIDNRAPSPPTPLITTSEVTPITVTALQNTALSVAGTRNKYWYSVHLWATWHEGVCGGLTYAIDWRITFLLGVRVLLLGF